MACPMSGTGVEDVVCMHHCSGLERDAWAGNDAARYEE